MAELLGMSKRWVQNQVRAGAEHQRYGNRVRFSPEQLAKLRERHKQGRTRDAPR